MRVSYTKEYLTDYIENTLIGILWAEFREAQRQLKIAIGSKHYREKDIWFAVHERMVLHFANDRLERTQGLLKTISNSNALNPIVLDTEEIQLLRL